MTVRNLFEQISAALVAEGWTLGDDTVALGDAVVGYEPEESDLYPGIYLTFDNFVSGHLDLPESPTMDDYLREIHIEVDRWEHGSCRACGIEGELVGGSAEVVSMAPGSAGICTTCREAGYV